MTSVIQELDIDFIFSDKERESLYKEFAAIKVNPYRHYTVFRNLIKKIADKNEVAPEFFEYMEDQISRDYATAPFLFIKNAPVDKILPIFDFTDPVLSKHFLKRTFIAEAFLSLYGHLSGSHPISYINVNDGDVFQDIYPKESMKDTQSQKALGEIYFHKDLANHFVRPDFVNILAMRSSPENETLTTFVKNVDILKALDSETTTILKSKDFYTPFDDLTVSSGNKVMGDADKHAVLQADNDIRFFENRTIGLTPKSIAAVTRLIEILKDKRKRVHMCPGDFISIHNNWSLHGKELGQIREQEIMRTRWMIKTVNIYNPEVFKNHLFAGTDYLVNG
jgi:L-asparagine oxygenase